MELLLYYISDSDQYTASSLILSCFLVQLSKDSKMEIHLLEMQKDKKSSFLLKMK